MELHNIIATVYFSIGKKEYSFYVNQKISNRKISLIEEENINGVDYVNIYSSDEENTTTSFWRVPSSHILIKYKNFN